MAIAATVTGLGEAQGRMVKSRVGVHCLLPSRPAREVCVHPPPPRPWAKQTDRPHPGPAPAPASSRTQPHPAHLTSALHFPAGPCRPVLCTKSELTSGFLPTSHHVTSSVAGAHPFAHSSPLNRQQLLEVRTSLIPTAKNTCARHWEAPEPSLEPEISSLARSLAHDPRRSAAAPPGRQGRCFWRDRANTGAQRSTARAAGPEAQAQ